MTILCTVEKCDHVDFGRYYLLSYTRSLYRGFRKPQFLIKKSKYLDFENVICILNKILVLRRLRIQRIAILCVAGDVT